MAPGVLAVVLAVGGCTSAAGSPSAREDGSSTSTPPVAGPTSTSTSSPAAGPAAPSAGAATPSPPATGTDAACPGPVPPDLDLDLFYGRYCDVLGIPLVAAEAVDPEALRIAAEAMRQMLTERPDVARALAQAPVRVGIIGRHQQTTDMPEWSDLAEAFPETDWDTRARGLGATLERPLVGSAEENLLCLPEDGYLGESIFVHELSHAVLEFGVQEVDPGFRTRLVDAYEGATAAGLWADTYAATTSDEYWAEAVQSYFDTNLAEDFQHNEVDTREELRAYDPALHGLVAEVFGAPTWRPACP